MSYVDFSTGEGTRLPSPAFKAHDDTDNDTTIAVTLTPPAKAATEDGEITSPRINLISSGDWSGRYTRALTMDMYYVNCKHSFETCINFFWCSPCGEALLIMGAESGGKGDASPSR